MNCAVRIIYARGDETAQEWSVEKPGHPVDAIIAALENFTECDRGFQKGIRVLTIVAKPMPEGAPLLQAAA